MNPYLCTLTFLMLMSILTSSEVNRFSHTNFNNNLYKNYQKNSLVMEETIAQEKLEDFKASSIDSDKKIDPVEKEKQPKDPAKGDGDKKTALGFNMKRPPNNSRLNLYLLMHQDEQHLLYDTMTRLIKKLYGESAFFQKRMGAANLILDSWIGQKEEMSDFAYADELCSIDLKNADLQTIVYHMFKGSENTSSLLDFVTFDSNFSRETKKINLLFANAALVESLLNDDRLSKSVLSLRDQVFSEILYQENHKKDTPKEHYKNRTDFKNELKLGFKQILVDRGLPIKTYTKFFDFSLGKPGNILFIPDQKSGLMQRTKYHSRN